MSTSAVSSATVAKHVAGAFVWYSRATIVMATLQDRFNINSQLEHLQAKYVGTGHADLGRFEWAVNVHRDSYASYIGHHPLVSYFAIAENESVGRKKYDRKCFYLAGFLQLDKRKLSRE